MGGAQGQLWNNILNQSTDKVQDSERGARIKAEREALGFSIVEFSKRVGVSKGSQILYEKGNPPTVNYLVAAGELGTDIIYILTGKRNQDAEPRVGTQVRRLDGTVLATYTGKSPKQLDGKDGQPATLVHLPVFDVRASAGLGLPVGPEVQLGAIAFAPTFLRDRGATPDQCSIITASGDSMQPSIPDGSLLVVDHSQTEIKNGHIMVINVGEDLLVKRIRRRVDGLIDLISDNPAYPPETLGPDTLLQLRVVGRVVYFCRVP